MDKDNAFDRLLDIRRPPAYTREAATYIAGNLELAWDLVQAVFKEHAQPALAVDVCRLITSRAELLRARHEQQLTEANPP